MSPEIIGFIGMFILMILLAFGMWIGAAAALVGIIGTIWIQGFSQAASITQQIPFQQITSYTLITIPMFVLMGSLISETGIGSKMFDTTNKWIGQFKGGLAMATVVACGLLGAVTADSFASIAIMSKVARPEMRKRHYDDRLIGGSISAGSSLSVIIPPTFVLVLYGILTEQPIGVLFIAGIIPGLLEVVFYLVTIYIMCSINPQTGPAGEKYSIKEKISSLKNMWAILLLIILVLGGIYGGFFTVTEAGAIGAMGTVLITLFRRTINFKIFVKCVVDAGTLAGWLLFMIAGIIFFQYFMVISKIPFLIGNYIASLDVPLVLVLLALTALYLVLGMFLPASSIIVLTVPILYPVILTLGLHPIWFGIVLVRMVEIGMITPPLGLNCYVLAGASGIPITKIFQGIFPFLIADILHLIVILAFPALSLFLVEMM